MAPSPLQRQNGATMVEFALGFMVFWTVVIGIVEFGRLMLEWQAAREATQITARYASICDMGSALPAQKGAAYLNSSGLVGPVDPTNNFRITYSGTALGSSCDVSTCRYVSVSTVGLQAQLMIPVLQIAINIPEAKIVAPRELMRTRIGADDNALCAN